MSYVGGRVLFSAFEPVHGLELWKSNGTDAGTVLVKDVYPGTNSGVHERWAKVNDLLYFTAYNDVTGYELWKSDGSPSGTELVKDIYPGAPYGSPDRLTSAEEKLFFVAITENEGRELWVSTSPACDYAFAKAPYNFEDISATGFRLGLYDDGSEKIILPFTVSFYCLDYDTVSVGANGTIHFSGTSPGASNSCLPFAMAEAFIAVYWTDLNPSENVFYEIRGSAPERRLIIQWDDVPSYPDVGAATFQAILYEHISDILFQYEDVEFGDGTIDFGANATVGVQFNKELAVSYLCNAPSLKNSMAILATAPGEPIVMPSMQLLLLGE
jgi:ELWxxDGT repeat protein